jgi:hypothetical protein
MSKNKDIEKIKPEKEHIKPEKLEKPEHKEIKEPIKEKIEHKEHKEKPEKLEHKGEDRVQGTWKARDKRARREADSGEGW